MARQHPTLPSELSRIRPVLSKIDEGQGPLETALDAERRNLIRANEARLAAYEKAAERWAALWPRIEREIARRPLSEANEVLVKRAEDVLPFRPN